MNWNAPGHIVFTTIRRSCYSIWTNWALRPSSCRGKGQGEGIMGDTSVMKVQSKHSPRGEMGQKHLALGIHVAMRLWDNEQPGNDKPMTTRDYETVGYVLSGRAELHLEGQ